MSAEPATAAPSARPGRRDLGARAGFGRLLTVRVASQWGDGIFQAALGGAVLFDPEHQSAPTMIALGLAVVLLPYALISPFAGALLDRWDRRRVLLAAAGLRAALMAATAGALAVGLPVLWVYLGALATLGCSRFIQAGLAAALPHVVTEHRLVAANSLVTTTGGIAAGVGGSTALVLTSVLGATGSRDGALAAVAAVASLLIVAVTLGFRPGVLGPDERPEPGGAVRGVALGLLDGARAARRAPVVVATFWALAGHRVAYGVSLLLTLLLVRGGVAPVGPLRAGPAGLGEAVGATIAGLGLAAVLTPWATARIGRAGTVRLAMVVALGAVALALPLTLPTLLGAAFLLGLVGQAVKLCSDATVQRDVADASRGRVFALSDTVFNVTFVLAAGLAALVAPADGRSVPMILLVGTLYLAGLAAHEVALRTRRAPTPEPAAAPDPEVGPPA